MNKLLPTDKPSDMLIDNFNVFIKNYQKFYEKGSMMSARRSRKALANIIVLCRKVRKEILFDKTFKIKK
jgi:hypothetical protein